MSKFDNEFDRVRSLAQKLICDWPDEIDKETLIDWLYDDLEECE